MNNPIVEEVRRHRTEIAARNEDDLRHENSATSRLLIQNALGSVRVRNEGISFHFDTGR